MRRDLTPNFRRAVERVLAAEGGYVNHPDDRGGETNYGISRRAYPELDIAGLTRDEARAIYRRDYWDATHCHELPGPVAEVVFDAAVNHGTRASVSLLQSALNRLFFVGDDLPRLAVDGLWGRMTRGALDYYVGNSPLAAHLLAREILLLRLARYAAQCADRSQRQFLLGWVNRLVELDNHLEG